MRTVFTLAVLIQATLASASYYDEERDTVPTGDIVSTESFCDTFKGAYKIDSANGMKPKPEAETALVDKDIESKECIFTFPYCVPDSSCDPGYLFYGFDKTKIYKQEANGSRTDFGIVSEVNGKIQKYTWRLENSKLTFINHQYKMPNGNIVNLEFIGSKKNDD